jgi:hypothetical protein
MGCGPSKMKFRSVAKESRGASGGVSKGRVGSEWSSGLGAGAASVGSNEKTV